MLFTYSNTKLGVFDAGSLPIGITEHNAPIDARIEATSECGGFGDGVQSSPSPDDI